MHVERMSSGSKVIDDLLGGGIESGVITNFYGPAGSGKTNLCLLFALSAIKRGSVAYVDTESGFSTERIFQMGGTPDDLKKIIYENPASFDDQKRAIEKLKKAEISLLIVDSFVSLYRLVLNEENVTTVNRELAGQMAHLSNIAREKNIPVIITNQVYSIGSNEIELSGRDVVKYWSKCLVEIKKSDENRRVAIIRKHRSMPEGKKAEFEITSSGIEKAKFKIF
ncbi:MAG: DNA repair and recombination protein RadB [Candidatus Aenigmarchaeota archaeon]|nr:DNA repair and recombination protein RadB [Candidatus Aenigmarchaeota archaeon]